MTNYDPAGNPAPGAPPTGGDYYASDEDVRYDLNGNPLPPTPGISRSPSSYAPPAYAQPSQGPPIGPPQPGLIQPTAHYAAPPTPTMPQAPPPPNPAGSSAHPGYGGPQMPGVIPPTRGLPPFPNVPAVPYANPPGPPYAAAPYANAAPSPPPYAANPHAGGPPPAPLYGAAPYPGQNYGGPQMPGGIPPSQGLPPFANYPATGAPFAGRPIGAAPRNQTAWYAAVAIGFIALVTVVFMSRVSHPEHIDAPVAYEHVDSGDKGFACDGPGGWDLAIDGAPGMDGGVHFSNGPVKINVMDSTALSFESDAMKAPGFGDAGESGDGGAGDNTPPPPPVEAMHQKVGQDVANDYPGYSEMPEQKLTVAYGDTRVSEWTSTGDWLTGKQHGYRATVMGLDKVVTVVCHCPDNDWDTMQPVFMKVIQSISPEPSQ
jgi:hypothetical protein